MIKNRREFITGALAVAILPASAKTQVRPKSDDLRKVIRILEDYLSAHQQRRPAGGIDLYEEHLMRQRDRLKATLDGS